MLTCEVEAQAVNFTGTAWWGSGFPYISGLEFSFSLLFYISVTQLLVPSGFCPVPHLRKFDSSPAFPGYLIIPGNALGGGLMPHSKTNNDTRSRTDMMRLVSACENAEKRHQTSLWSIVTLLIVFESGSILRALCVCCHIQSWPQLYEGGTTVTMPHVTCHMEEVRRR